MHHIQKSVVSLVVIWGVSLGLLVTGAQAQSGSLEPPGSAVNGSGDPVATTQTQPSWDQRLPVAERFVQVLTGASGFPLAILDRNTGLVWEQGPGDINGDSIITFADTLDWDSARRYCLNQNDGGVGGWRLPSVHELRSLYDPTNPNGNPDLPAGHPFSLVQSSFYWSATANVDDPARAWVVLFGSGFVGAGSKASAGFVWCVRGGGPLSEY